MLTVGWHPQEGGERFARRVKEAAQATRSRKGGGRAGGLTTRVQ